MAPAELRPGGNVPTGACGWSPDVPWFDLEEVLGRGNDLHVFFYQRGIVDGSSFIVDVSCT